MDSIAGKCAAVHDGTLQCKCLLKGEWRESASAATVAIKNPCDGSVVGTVQACTRGEVDEAFAAAREAFAAWARTPLWRRAEVVHRAAAALRERAAAMGEVLMRAVATARTDSFCPSSLSRR